MAVFATEAIGLTKGQANLVLLGLAVAAVVGSFGWGQLVERIGPKRTLIRPVVVGDRIVIGRISIGMPDRSGSGCSSWPARPRQQARQGSGRRPGVHASAVPAGALGILRVVRPRQEGLLVISAALRPDPAQHSMSWECRLPGRRAEPARDDAHRGVAHPARLDRWSSSGELDDRATPPPSTGTRDRAARTRPAAVGQRCRWRRPPTAARLSAGSSNFGQRAGSTPS
jgi:hypothetical protein